MMKLRDAWNRSDPTKGRYNISGWWKYDHPCDRTSDYAGWRGIRCSGVLASDGNSTVCELFIVELGAVDRGIIGELVPEIGNLRNLQYIRISNNPGLTGSIPPSIWQLPNLKEVSFINNSLSGSIVFPVNYTKEYSLERLDLSQNKFTVWENKGKPLWNLVYLNLSNNLIGGNFNLGRYNSSGHFIGGIYTRLNTLDLSNNRFNNTTGSEKSSEWDLPALQALYMRNNSFGGALRYINSTLLNSPKIQLVYFDSNGLSGTLTLPTIAFENSSLNTLSLTDNNLTNIVYPSGNTDSTLSRSHLQIASILFLGGNPVCNTSDQMDPIPVICRYNRASEVNIKDKRESNIRNIIILAAAIPATILLIVIFILAYVFLENRRKHRYLLLGIQEKFAEHELKPTLFTYSELQKATRDFHADMRLGEGAFGAVYKGQLPDGTEVAVKQLFNTTQQSMDEFLNEVVLLTGIKHRNLVKLKGCCLRGDRRLLVYEYVENSDLADVLFGHTGENGGQPSLSWPQRFNICLGVAQGLHYLHALVDPKIIHRDIKASNILLDRKLEAKIADFGMALLFPSDMSHVMTVHIAGTKGYLAPEYASLGQLSEKADVWSYGVLLLEVVAGRSNIDGTLEPDKMYLASWAWNMHEEGRITDLVDARLVLRSDEELRQAHRFIQVALSCLQIVAERRPTMAQVVTMLQNYDTDTPLVIGNYPFSERASSQQSISQITVPESGDDTWLRSGAESSTTPLYTSGSIEITRLRAR
ncbi:hypothetical protein M758_1G277800 [Ceratodon purpureus]|nr:hypothetical protein M758_1G277800 [Ceratodon purpureus]KAG0631771.1 hypothetical protein M758_1G277800 [Ceratodon purpureus]